MKICYIENGKNCGTAASAAIASHLERHADVFHRSDISLDFCSQADIEAIAGEAYDLICVAGLGETARVLARSRLSARLVMLAGAGCDLSQSDETWKEIARHENIRVISFLSHLHYRATLLGVNSFYASYFPSPADQPHWDQPLVILSGQNGSELPPKIADTLFPNDPDLHLHAEQDTHAGEGGDPSVTTGTHPVPPASLDDDLFFLRVMAAGRCVVTPSCPAAREYITHGVNGLLYDPDRPEPLEISRPELIGRRARRTIEQGHRQWQWDLENRLHRLLFSPVLDTPESYRELGVHVRTGLGEQFPAPPASETPLPKVSVAVVCYNAEREIEGTLKSIFAQTYGNMEIVVVDGQSTDRTWEILNRNRYRIHVLVSEPDAGIYDAMNKAAQLGSGDYIVFINAGDHFHLPSSLETAMQNIFRDREEGEFPDFIIGDHVYLDENGISSLHKAAVFDDTWSQLQSGRFQPGWWQGIPCHQATLTRRRLLADEGYDLTFEITADHAFMFSMRSRGARFEHCHSVIAAYSGGGVSATRPLQCMRESFRVSCAHTQAIAAVRHFYLQTWGEETILPDPEKTRAEADLLCRSGLFCEEWYKARYMEGTSAFRDPILHYLLEWRVEGSWPHPFFDSIYYAQQNPEVFQTGQNPLVHYVLEGRARGLATCATDDDLLRGLAVGSDPDPDKIIRYLAGLPRDQVLLALRGH